MQDLDHAWVARARDGDQGAFQRLVNAHGRRLFHVCFRVTRDETLAEDAVQEAFINAWRRLDKFDGRSKFSTWLHRIAINAAVDQLRRDRRFTKGRVEDDHAIESVENPAPGPERAAVSSDSGAAVDAALSGLSDMERTAFTLRHHEGVSMAEIADVLDASEGACRQAVFRAVRKLRAALTGYGESHESVR